MWFEIVFSVVAVLGFVFNVFILFTVIKHRTLRKKSYIILVSLAVCDLFKVIIIVDIIIYKSMDNHSDICLGTSALGLILISSTTLHLCFESINRCFLILTPLKYDVYIKKKIMALFLFIVWLLPVFMSLLLPILIFGDDWKDSMTFRSHMFVCHQKIHTNTSSSKGFREMEELFSMSKAEHVLLCVIHVLFFAAPLVVMFICYGLILRLSYQTAQKIRKDEVDSNRQTIQSPAVTKSEYSNPIIKMVATTYDTSVVSGNLGLPRQITHEERSGSVAKLTKEIMRLVKIRKRELKAGKTVLIIILAFVLCNSPVFIVTWNDMMQGEHKTSTSIRELLLGIAFLQVFIDPAIYFLRLKDYKDVRKKCKKFGHSAIRKTRKTFRGISQTKI